MSRPDSDDLFALKPGFLSWVRDQAYDFVYYEIGTGLDFIGDLFRGPSGYSQSLHRQAEKAKTPKGKPLSKAEQGLFATMLKREPGEGQVAYWKRKKALLRHPDKHALVTAHRANEKARQAQTGQDTIVVEANASPGGRARGMKRTQTRGQRR